MITEVSLFNSDPLPGRGENSKQKSLGSYMTGDFCVIEEYMIDLCSKGDKIIA